MTDLIFVIIIAICLLIIAHQIYLNRKHKPENKEAHDIKNEYTTDMLQVHSQAVKLNKQAQELQQKVENSVAYKMAKATGRI